MKHASFYLKTLHETELNIVSFSLIALTRNIQTGSQEPRPIQ